MAIHNLLVRAYDGVCIGIRIRVVLNVGYVRLSRLE